MHYLYYYIDSAFGSRLLILIHWPGFRLSALYLDTSITCLNTLSRVSAPYLSTLPTRIGNQSESSTRVVSQSESSITSTESSITSPESSRLGLKTLLGSRLESARYSLSQYIGSSTTPPLHLSSPQYYSHLFRVISPEKLSPYQRTLLLLNDFLRHAVWRC